MNTLRSLVAPTLVLCLFAPALPVAAQSPGFLTTEKSSADPLDIAMSYLRGMDKARLLEADLADLVLIDRFASKHNGTTHLYFRQTVGGIEVASSHTAVHVARDGRIISLDENLVRGLRTAVNAKTPALSAEQAIGYAADHLGYEITGRLTETEKAAGPALRSTFTGAGLSLDPIPAKLVYHALEDGSARLAWDLVILTPDQKHHWNVFIDAVTGDELARHDWLAWDAYEVFALPKESPSDGPRTIETNPADATASPFGWHDTNGVAGPEFTVTAGNNVCAQTDRDANNSACGTETQPDGGATLDFTGAVVPLDLATQEPSEYQEAAVANLFYWNNIVHDVLYQYGFDEASGNFQENNYGRGGLGSDSVNADAQDGSGTDNANFSTPPDGSNPRMQMYEWTPPFINELVVDPPSGAAGTYFGSAADFGPALDATGVSGSIVLVNDGTGTTSDACEALVNGAQVSGNLALIDRGTCTFVVKVKNAQNAGAVGVVMVNNVDGNPITMGGTDNTINIPSMMISLADGQTVKSGLPATGTERAALNPPPNRDSDLDAGIIAHEYCHGLSIRLTGGAQTSNCLSGNQQAGEGWSDLCTLFLTPAATDTGATARGVGTYSLFEPADGLGIRPYPYSTDMGVNPITYGELAAGTLTIPHGVGFVWATAVWEVYWNLVDAYGFDPDLYAGTGGNNLAFQLIVDGLKLQPCNPTFLDARDAILLADQQNNGGANECLIWEGFAKRGMGVNADDGGTSNSLNVTENFELPAQCVTGCGNGICESGEDCNTCPGDCIGGTSSGAVCGNGICESGNGETCETCAADCAGQTGGKPSGRFCCGSADSLAPNGCGDSRCTTGGFQCTEVPVPGGSYCCGDLSCDAGEDCSSCALDCTIGAEVCTGGLDEDCNGLVDCDDSVCTDDPNCQQADCSQFTDKTSCNAAAGCRWDNKNKVCVAQ